MLKSLWRKELLDTFRINEKHGFLDNENHQHRRCCVLLAHLRNFLPRLLSHRIRHLAEHSILYSFWADDVCHNCSHLDTDDPNLAGTRVNPIFLAADFGGRDENGGFAQRISSIWRHRNFARAHCENPKTEKFVAQSIKEVDDALKRLGNPQSFNSKLRLKQQGKKLRERAMRFGVSPASLLFIVGSK